MADFAGGAIQAFVGPPELGAADDLETIIVGFIDEAQESLDIAVQEIDSEIIDQAILDARWRGVSVRGPGVGAARQLPVPSLLGAAVRSDVGALSG